MGGRLPVLPARAGSVAAGLDIPRALEMEGGSLGQCCLSLTPPSPVLMDQFFS